MLTQSSVGDLSYNPIVSSFFSIHPDQRNLAKEILEASRQHAYKNTTDNFDRLINNLDSPFLKTLDEHIPDYKSFFINLQTQLRDCRLDNAITQDFERIDQNVRMAENATAQCMLIGHRQTFEKLEEHLTAIKETYSISDSMLCDIGKFLLLHPVVKRECLDPRDSQTSNFIKQELREFQVAEHNLLWVLGSFFKELGISLADTPYDIQFPLDYSVLPYYYPFMITPGKCHQLLLAIDKAAEEKFSK